MARSDMSDLEWEFIKAVLPNKTRGKKRVDDRRVINGIFYVLRTGIPWADLPEQYGPPTTVYNRFNRWSYAGHWDRIMDALAAAHDAAVQMIDTSIIRVHQHGACIANNSGQHIGRSRGGLTSKDPCRCGCQWFAGATRPHWRSGARQPALLGLAATAPSARAVAGRSRLRCGLD